MNYSRCVMLNIYEGVYRLLLAFTPDFIDRIIKGENVQEF